jgi:hypothetical protein
MKNILKSTRTARFIQTSRTSSSGMKTQRLRDPLHDLIVLDTRHL